MSGTWRRVCPVEDLDPARPIARMVAAGDGSGAPVCVVSHEGEPVVLLDRCPHRDIRLSSGVISEGELVCSGHFWRFDLHTGRRTDAPVHAATIHPSRVVDGWVEALVPDPPVPVSMREWLLAQACRDEPGGSSGLSAPARR